MQTPPWRFVGPYRGGRVMAVAGYPADPRAALLGSTGGGVWRTTDGGASWQNLSDRYFRRSSVGALAIAPSDPQVLYAGMGECGFRSNVTGGDGVYRSRDGGRSWVHLGLAETQNIGRIRVHPADPDRLYVAALGHRFGPNPERGVYRSADGGHSWEQVLERGDAAGAVDLAMDPSNPRILYAALWEARRYPWGCVTGGHESGIWKSTDGGETWADLRAAPGLPRGTIGRIAVCVSPVRPDRLYALIAAPERGGVYRSNDGGAHWTWMNNDPNFMVRGWYETHIVADPLDPDTVWLPNRKLWKSTDGGRTFAQLNTSYWDQHDLWIDPRDPRHLVLGNDGGAAISLDGGASWSSVFNQPTAELYHIAADTRVPYRIYTAQQDNSTLSLPSRSDRGPISEMDWYDVGGGESGHIQVRPDDPEVVFASDLAGGITRYDHRTLALRDISVWPEETSGWPPEALPYRWNWSLPLLLSRHAPGVLYAAGNRLFRTADEGHSWEPISPDLSRRDAEALAFARQPDPAHWRENGEDHDYATIASLAEGIVPGVLWAGSDDGVLSLTRDEGATWRAVTPPDLPPFAWCAIEASPHRPGGAYLAASRHRLDDFRPYLYRTEDYGESWRAIAGGIPEDQFVRVVRADPERAGLLYCGTEAGAFFSPDDGARWLPLQEGLPACAVHDLAVHGGDLLAATHGRGAWILDDLSPLRQGGHEPPLEAARLLAPRPAYRLIRQIVGKTSYITMGYPDAEPSPPCGVEVCYLLRERPAGPLTLTLRDAEGRVVSAYRSAAVPAPPSPLGPLAYRMPSGVAVLSARGADDPEPGVRVGMRPRPLSPGRAPSRGGGERPPAEPGLNRFAIPLQYPGAEPLPGYRAFGSTAVPLPPGAYTVELRLGELLLTAPALVLPDPRSSASREDYAAQAALGLRLRDLVGAVHAGALRARALRLRIAAWLGTQGADWIPAVTRVGEALQAALAEVEQALVQWDLSERSGELADSKHPVRLNGKLEWLAWVVGGCDGAPTAQALALFEALSAQAEAQLTRLRTLARDDLSTFNSYALENHMEAVPPL